MIRIENLTHAYPRAAALFTELNVTLKPQEILGILGPNGAGKTTLLKLIAGLVKHQNGSIWWDTSDINALSAAQRAQHLSYLPQHDGLTLDFTVLEIVLMGRQLYQSAFGFDRPEDVAAARAALQACHAHNLSDRCIHELSGGERRRVLLARSLAQQSEVLLLDEPLAHLDIRYQIELAKLFLELRAEQKRSLIISLHDINLAAQLCDRILLLGGQGQYLLGPPRTILNVGVLERYFGVSLQALQGPSSAYFFSELKPES